ncbi:hypothetical protein B0H14DRAFT_2641056 [Mycena olivaceomarginata]|nr:hypothetical protein B0H14DRAFT_2641056 [Mycena olivaceomarginata]
MPPLLSPLNFLTLRAFVVTHTEPMRTIELSLGTIRCYSTENVPCLAWDPNLRRSSRIWRLTSIEVDDLVEENGKIKCPYCGYEISAGASLQSAKGNWKTHVAKSADCKRARASLNAPKQSKLSRFFGKPKPYALPTIPPIVKSKGPEPSTSSPSDPSDSRHASSSSLHRSLSPPPTLPSFLSPLSWRNSDWIWEKGRGKTFTAPGRFVELMDPDVNVSEGQAARLLFDSQDILAIGAMLFGRMTTADGVKIQSIPRTANFPYQNKDGKLCFLCEDADVEKEIARIGSCAHCVPPVKIGSRIPDILNHNAGHILFDPRDQGGGSALRFSYQTASVSEPNNPSSNVPLPCPASGCRSVPWKYNLPTHFKVDHPGQEPAVYNDFSVVSHTEKGRVKALWDGRHVKKPRKSKKSRATKGIEQDAAEMYKTSHALRINEDEHDESNVSIRSPRPGAESDNESSDDGLPRVQDDDDNEVSNLKEDNWKLTSIAGTRLDPPLYGQLRH